jgi:hypothetical protein
MAVPGFFAQEVVTPDVQCPTLGAGMPAPISQMTVSCWTCNAVAGASLEVTGPIVSLTRSLFQLLFTTSTGATGATQLANVGLYATNVSGGAIVGGAGTFYNLRDDIAFYDQTTTDGLTEYHAPFLTHWLVAVDFLAQSFVAYANGQPLLTHTVGSWHRAVAPDAMVLAPWQVRLSGAGAGVADFWMHPSFIDLSVPAVRSQFINADLSAVALPSDGHITVSGSTVTPAVFLHALAAGSPSDFIANNGTGPDWAITSGSLAFQPEPGSCVLSTTVTPPPVETLKLALDDVVCTTIPALQKNLISLSWSNDRGRSYGNPVTQPMGEAGEYRTSLQWQRLEYSRDRVFKLEWSVACRTALQGCWVDVTPASS